VRNIPFRFACPYVLIFSLTTTALAANNQDSSNAVSNQSEALASRLGVHFVEGSATTVILERDGKRYELDLAMHEVHDVSQPAQGDPSPQAVPQADASASTSKGDQAANSNVETRRYYRPGDDLLFTIPSGRPIEKHSLTVNFTHRFPYEAAFTGQARGATLLGLDDFAVPSFGFQYGITSRLSVSAYRSPTIISRPIELGVKYSFLDEKHGPFNATGRFSVDGEDNFSRNFTSNFELVTSRSLGRRAQLYVVPTLSIHNRPVLAAQTSLINPPAYQPCSQQFANDVPLSLHVRPCANTFSIGFGVAVDIRPTVALVAEGIPTFVNGTELGIHRMPFSFGIQKKIFHHSFTFGFTTAPGTDTSQRIATRSIFLRDPHNDTPGGMFVGFDLMRQLP
jgi:Membrane bound beta barrel domain (DUF5777)